MANVTATIITLNEAAHIEPCLASVSAGYQAILGRGDSIVVYRSSVTWTHVSISS